MAMLSSYNEYLAKFHHGNECSATESTKKELCKRPWIFMSAKKDTSGLRPHPVVEPALPVTLGLLRWWLWGWNVRP